MRMMSELTHMYLYGANKKVYAPINEKNRRKGSAILLLAPNMQESIHLTRLPYVFNPDLFVSYYFDRDVGSFINKKAVDEFDENEAKAVSEAMVNYTNRIKFKMDKVSSMDERYIRNAYDNKIIMPIIRSLEIQKVPDYINVVTHTNLADLRKNAPKNILKECGKDYFSYTEGTTIHVLSNFVYDAFTMRGNYDSYLLGELIYALIVNYNNDIPYITAKGIAYAMSGLYTYLANNDTSNIGSHNDKAISFGADIIMKIIDSNNISDIAKYIKTGDLKVFVIYTAKQTISHIRKIIFEGNLSYTERQRLLPSEFGLPNKREYPIHDEEHVKLAVKMFNHCDSKDEKELAQNIIKRIKRYGITDIHPSASNRFSKYYKNPKPKTKSIHESAPIENDEQNEKYILRNDEKWEMVKSVCSHLSPQELGRITFTDDYENSKFVIKRYVARVNVTDDDGNTVVTPAGFLDLYHFPSNPDIAQIVIAVDNRYRGFGVARNLVGSLLNDADALAKEYGFNILYWTAHQDNYASQYLASFVGGFEDTNTIDKYGRKVYVRYINPVKFNDREIDKVTDSSAYVSDDAIVTNEAAFLHEANTPNRSTYLRKYLYSERIKTDKVVLSMYKQVKAFNSSIRYTYLKIDMYKERNLFVDLSYYHALFLKNNIFKMDNAVNFYFEFLNTLMDNKEVNRVYPMQTVFIPVDAEVWNIQPGTDMTDYKKNLNPISIIFRLVRTNLQALRDAWGNKDIVFVSERGYFKVDFSIFDAGDIAKFKKNINRLNSVDPIMDDEEYPDELNDTKEEDTNSKSSTKAIANAIVDKLEKNGNLKIDDVSTDEINGVSLKHLSITDGPLNITTNKGNNEVVVIDMDPNGPDGFNKLKNTVLSKLSTKINAYCMPK